MGSVGAGLLGLAQVALALWPLIVVPAALLLLVRPVARLVFALLGLVFCVVASRLLGPFGPDDSRVVFPLLGLALLPAALIAEGLSRGFRAARRRGWLGRRGGPGR
jgi:hypothetical protein